MDNLKPYFLIPYIGLAAALLFFCMYQIFLYGFFSIWLGPVVTILPFILFMAVHMSKSIARTSENLWPISVFSALGLLICIIFGALDQTALTVANTAALTVAIIGLAGNLLYVFWYSRNNRPYNPILSIGSFLPEFSLKTIDGQLITSGLIKAEPALILFYRGNWCPLCMKQIREIADIADELADSGIQIYLIGAQSIEETNKIANKYAGYPMQFLFDPFFRAMGELGLVHVNGKPKGMIGFERDTAYPTVLYVNKGGEILWSDESNNYRLRPDPETFLQLKSNFQNSAINVAHPVVGN